MQEGHQVKTQSVFYIYMYKHSTGLSSSVDTMIYVLFYHEISCHEPSCSCSC